MSHKEEARRFWIEVFNHGNFAPIDEMIADNYTFNGQAQTKQDLKQWVTGLRTEFPDIHFEINDLLGDGAQVAVRWTLFCTDPKTKQELTNSGTNIVTFVEGKAVTNWQNGGTPQDMHPATQQAGAAA